MMAEGSSRSVSVLIADDHPVVRQGLRTILQQQDLHVVGEASTGAQALDQVLALRPDVVLMDIRMPDANGPADGLAATRRIREAAPTVAVIILSAFADRDYLLRALESGACGYLLKGTAAPALAHAVRLAKDGICALDAGLVAELISSCAQVEDERGRRALIEQLSPRELEVLQLLAQGYSNREIAAHIHYSVATAKSAVSRILRKLEVKDRAQAALLAARSGLAPG